MLLLTLGSAEAKMYKYVDENGVVHLTNVPTEVKFKPTIKTKKKTTKIKVVFPLAYYFHSAK